MELFQLPNGDWFLPIEVVSVYKTFDKNRNGEDKWFVTVQLRSLGVELVYDTEFEANRMRDELAKNINNELNWVHKENRRMAGIDD